MGTGVRTLAVLHNWESPFHRHQRSKAWPWQKHWCIPYHLTQSSMGNRTFNLGDSVFLYTGNAGKVTGSLWRRCSEPHTTENESAGTIRFEREMGTPTCVHSLKVYKFYRGNADSFKLKLTGTGRWGNVGIVWLIFPAVIKGNKMPHFASMFV